MRSLKKFPVIFISTSLMLFVAFEAKSQSTLTGTVLDESQSPLPSATVLILDPADSTLFKGNVKYSPFVGPPFKVS